MRVRVRYFASLRETLGAEEWLELSEAEHTLAAIRDHLIARGGERARVLARGRAVRAALDQRLCAESVVVRDGAEVAFFPPVTGG